MVETLSEYERYYTRDQAAHFLQEKGLKVAPASLATMACRGGGPRYAIFGKRSVYRESDLLEWATGLLGASAKTATERRHASKSEVKK
jgi:hypothetical protein